MIKIRSATGMQIVNAHVLECTADDARKLVAALTKSSSTTPYSPVWLPGGHCLRQVLIIAEVPSDPKPEHKPIEGL